MPEISLHKKVRDGVCTLKRFSPEKISVPEYIETNLKYSLFKWQKEALESLMYYEHENSGLKKLPTHLMFNMATGTGKTLVMAATILYFYKQGYRHFLFFVNQNNIVNKTENNFINKSHNKYLFKEKIVIDNKKVELEKVETFSDNPINIEIKFTTIQQLYNDIHIERENRMILEDLNDKNIVMLSDESHHLNSSTQKKSNQLELDLETEITQKTSAAEIERKGWEHTVINLLLHKRGKGSRNILLEFTATIPNNIDIQNKYLNKLIYKFDLKNFIEEKYTKEINLISSKLSKKERIIHSLLLNWYREKIALKYYQRGIKSLANFKPIILFRSRTTEESKLDYEEFKYIIRNLSSKDFKFLENISNQLYDGKSIHEQGKSRTLDIINYIKNNNFLYSKIADDIKSNFKEQNLIITNTKENKTKTEKTNESQEKLLNNLEDPDNHIRAIFTVKRLTEGWDVLNLYDIVRLYKGQNSGGSTKKTPESTTAEKQLIGRGVRYYPFSYEDIIPNQRKFDENPSHELRVLEELYYYTYDEDSRYISHLKEELIRDGYISDKKVKKKFDFKDEFKKTDFYNESILWVNKRIKNPNRKKASLSKIKLEWDFQYSLNSFEYNEEKWNSNTNDIAYNRLNKERKKTVEKTIRDFDKHIVYKGLNIHISKSNSLLQFSNLKKELDIKSLEDIFSDEYIGKMKINIVMPKDMNFSNISNSEQLSIIIAFFQYFETKIKEYINPYKGTTSFTAKKLKDIFSNPKTKIVEEDDESKKIAKSLEREEWYVLNDFNGTSEEIGLLKEIQKTIGNLENNYEEVYLLRNEEVYKIYDFHTGRGFQPDFLLFLKSKINQNVYYHVYMEPKGDNLIDRDQWKENLLKDINKKYSDSNISELIYNNKSYFLQGLPLFNIENIHLFRNEYQKLWE